VSQCARHVPPFASWIDVEQLPDAVAALEPEHVARFLASRRGGRTGERSA
jgi:hypothetical protein